MAKVSFTTNNNESTVAEPSVSKPAEAAAAAPAEVSHPVPATVPRNNAPAVYSDDDNIGLDEIVLPRINLVQGIGDLSTIFEKGEIVLNKELVIYTPGGKDTEKSESLDITIVGFRPTQWTEKIAGGAMGRLFASPAEVVAVGGTTSYDTWQAATKAKKDVPYFEPLATALVLIRKPAFVEDEDGAYFGEVFGEHHYTLALWSMKGGAYTNGAKVLKTARKIRHLRSGYATYSWKLDTLLKKYPNGNSAYIPSLKPGEKHGPEFAAFLANALGAGPNESSE